MSFGYPNPRFPPRGGFHPRFGGGPRPPWGGFHPHFRGPRPFMPMNNFGSGGGGQEDPFENGPPQQQQGHHPPPPPCWPLQPGDVMAWLDHQHPFILKRIHFHVRWLLEQHGVPIPDTLEGEEENKEGGEEEDSNENGDDTEAKEDTSGWYNEEAINGSSSKEDNDAPTTAKVPRYPGFGFSPHQPLMPPPPRGPMQWTPAGWVVKDNSHKVTTTMRPLPEVDIIPPQSNTYCEANTDRDKLRMLHNNVNVMQFELNKICRKFRIGTLNKDDLTSYPEDQQQRLKTAVNCVAAAENTLEEFKEFLREDKYCQWNTEQKKKQEEKVREMIGETPTMGVPHRSNKAAAESEEAADE